MATSSVTHILLVDDHPVVRKGLAAVIDEQNDLKVCAQAGNHNEAMAAIAAHRIDVALVDLRLEEGSGLSLISDIIETAPSIKTIVFSMHDDTQFAERAIRAGARGYVMKQEPTAVLLQAIRRVRDGELYVRPELSYIVARQGTPAGRRKLKSDLDGLTDREIEVLQLMAEGLNRREIALELDLSVKTIDSYRENLKKKLDLRDTVQLAQYAVRTLNPSNI